MCCSFFSGSNLTDNKTPSHFVQQSMISSLDFEIIAPLSGPIISAAQVMQTAGVVRFILGRVIYQDLDRNSMDPRVPLHLTTTHCLSNQVLCRSTPIHSRQKVYHFCEGLLTFLMWPIEYRRDLCVLCTIPYLLRAFICPFSTKIIPD